MNKIVYMKSISPLLRVLDEDVHNEKKEHQTSTTKRWLWKKFSNSGE